MFWLWCFFAPCSGGLVGVRVVLCPPLDVLVLGVRHLAFLLFGVSLLGFFSCLLCMLGFGVCVCVFRDLAAVATLLASADADFGHPYWSTLAKSDFGQTDSGQKN